VAVEDKIKVGGILQYGGLCLIGVMSAPDRPGIAAAIFQALGQAQINAQFIVQNIDLNKDAHVQFCVAAEDSPRVLAALGSVVPTLGAQKVIEYGPVALICVFGPDFRERPGIAGATFGALARAGINILAVSTSISTIACVIDDPERPRALEALQTVFAVP
jgi:aspartate kinase